MGSWWSRSDHKIYYENGKLERHEICENGNRVEGKYWYENGQLEEHTFYNGNKREGNSKSWHRNGLIRRHTFYHEEKLEGKYMRWYDNGRPHLKAFCRVGKIDGESRLYDRNGRLGEHLYWKNGNQVNQNFSGCKRRILFMLKQWLHFQIHSGDLDEFLISDLRVSE